MGFQTIDKQLKILVKPQVGKVSNFKSQVGNLNFSQIIGR